MFFKIQWMWELSQHKIIIRRGKPVENYFGIVFVRTIKNNEKSEILFPYIYMVHSRCA